MKKDFIEVANMVPSFCFTWSNDVNWIQIVQVKEDVFMGVSQSWEWVGVNDTIKVYHFKPY